MRRICEYGATCDLPSWGVSRLIGFLGISRHNCLAPANERCGTFRVPPSTGSSSIFVHFPTMTSVLSLHFVEGWGRGKVEGSDSVWINLKFTHPIAIATGVESSSGGGGAKRP